MVILIIGLGSIARKHIEALRKSINEPTIYALRSGKNNIFELGVIDVTDISELSEKPDFVIISNPTSFHADAIMQVAKMKTPIFIEKPPLHTLTSVYEIMNMIEMNDVTTYVACNLRFHPCITYLESYVKEKSPQINEVNVYCGSYLPDWRPGRDFMKIYSAVPEMGGGVNLDMFHEFDYVCWIFGLPDKYNGYKSNRSSLNIAAADYANYILEYPDYNISIILNYYRRKTKRSIEILFANETWEVDLINNIITSDDGTVVFENKDHVLMDTYVSQINYFIKMLQLGKKPMNSLEESINILKISLA